jgi:hypothetical protein
VNAVVKPHHLEYARAYFLGKGVPHSMVDNLVDNLAKGNTSSGGRRPSAGEEEKSGLGDKTESAVDDGAAVASRFVDDGAGATAAAARSSRNTSAAAVRSVNDGAAAADARASPQDEARFALCESLDAATQKKRSISHDDDGEEEVEGRDVDEGSAHPLASPPKCMRISVEEGHVEGAKFGMQRCDVDDVVEMVVDDVEGDGAVGERGGHV